MYILFCQCLEIFIERTPFKNVFDVFVNFFKRVFYVTVQVKKILLSTNIIELSIFIAYCMQIAHKNQEEKRSYIVLSGTLHIKLLSIQHSMEHMNIGYTQHRNITNIRNMLFAIV